MKNASWAIYITALLIGSSLAIVSDASVSEFDGMPGSPGCTVTGCTICFPESCILEWWEHKHYYQDVPSLRCVDWDGDGVGHCAWVDAKSYTVHNLIHQFVRYCLVTNCGSGEWTTEVCADPWTPPDPE